VWRNDVKQYYSKNDVAAVVKSDDILNVTVSFR
jgi:hypothetical protein